MEYKKEPPDVYLIGDIDMEYKALRYNEGKPQWSLVHMSSVEPLVRVLEFGAQKYARDNWKLGLEKSKILDSMQRHLASLIDGEEFDKESGIQHVGHIMANAMFYEYYSNLERSAERK